VRPVSRRRRSRRLGNYDRLERMVRTEQPTSTGVAAAAAAAAILCLSSLRAHRLAHPGLVGPTKASTVE